MVYNPFTVDGVVYEVVSGTGTVYENAKVYLYDVTTGGYMHTTTNAAGEYSLDLSDSTMINEMAKKFEVSTQAMSYRIINLADSNLLLY